MNKVRVSKKYIFGAVVLLFMVCLVATGGVLAKYISTLTQGNNIFPVTSKEFYFESNRLTSDGKEYQLNADTTSVEIELYNFENEFRVSEVDCKYTVTVSFSETEAPPKIYMDDVEINEPIDVAGNSAKTTKLVLKNLKKGHTYTVSVTADGGYSKTLSAKFTVANDSGFYMNVKDAGEYVLLTVWTENVTGDVNITFPDGLIPDATDPILTNVKNYENGEYVGKSFSDESSFGTAYSSHAYRFFKAANYDPDDPDNGKFEVRLNDSVIDTSSNIP